MKFKFLIKKHNIEHLNKAIYLAYSIWNSQKDKIRFYFDDDQMIIYPEVLAGFNCVHTRIYVFREIEGRGSFFEQYSIKSQKEKNHMVMTFDLSTLIEDLRVYIELDCDVQFKLAQDTQGKKYFELTGVNTENIITKTRIDINSFEKEGPEELPDQAVSFNLDPTTCSFVFQKFHQRFNIVSDQVCQINFNANDNDELNQDQNDEGDKKFYNIYLESQFLKVQVNQRFYPAEFKDRTDMKEKYSAKFKKDMFNKFFHCLKLPGQATLKITHDEQIELDYQLEKCQHITTAIYTTTRRDVF